MISVGANYSQTISQNQCPGGSSQSYASNTEFVFTDVPKRPMGDGTLTVRVRGDYDFGREPPGGVSEGISVVVEGVVIEPLWVPETQCSFGLLTKTFILPQEKLREWATDGKIEVTLVQGGIGYLNEVNCFCSARGTYEGGCPAAECGNINIVTLEYTGANNSLPMNWIIKKFGLGKEK